MTEDLTSEKMRLLEILVFNSDMQAAAEAVGVSRATAYRWLQEREFKEELARQRDAVLSTAMAGIKTLAERAVTELANLLNTKDDRLRRQLCNDLLSHAIKVRELEDYENRLVALEKATQEKRGAV